MQRRRSMSSACSHEDVTKTSFHSAIAGQPAGLRSWSLRMNTSRFRFTALAFSTLLVFTACKPGSDAPTAAGAANAPQATLAGDQVAAEITVAGSTFI